MGKIPRRGRNQMAYGLRAYYLQDHMVSEDNYFDLLRIPESVSNLDECIELLIKDYWKHNPDKTPLEIDGDNL